MDLQGNTTVKRDGDNREAKTMKFLFENEDKRIVESEETKFCVIYLFWWGLELISHNYEQGERVCVYVYVYVCENLGLTVCKLYIALETVMGQVKAHQDLPTQNDHTIPS